MSVPGTPSSLATLGAAGLRRTIWSENLKHDSVRPSVFTSPELAADFQLNTDGEIVINRKGILLDIMNVGQAGAGQSVRCAMRTGFRKRPQLGTGEDMLGNGDEGGLKWAEFKYNELKKAAKMYMYGWNFNDTSYLDVNGTNPKLLGSFWAEYNDFRFQQALQLQISEELTYTPITASFQINPNVLVPNIAYSDNPAYDVDALTVTDGAADTDSYYSSRTYGGAGTYVQNVATAMMAGATTGSTPRAVFSVDHVSALISYIQDMHLVEPIELDGMITWILKVGPKTAAYMLNPSVSGSFGSLFTSVAAYKSSERNLIPGEIGRIMDHFLVVKDWRTPTCTISGDSGAYSMKYGYIMPSNNDDRNNSAWAVTSGATNYVFEMNAVLGANAVARYTRDSRKDNLAETTEFGKIKEIGTYFGEGIQLPIFNNDTATASSHIYRGSCILPHSICPIDAIVAA
jgi:hypothetical protein